MKRPRWTAKVVLLALVLAGGADSVAAAPAGARFVLAWPPTRYPSAELAIFRAEVGATPLTVRVTARGLDVTVDVPPSSAVRVPLPEEARCGDGVDACAIVVARASGEGAFHVLFQSPDTAGVPDTLVLTAHDAVRLRPVGAAGRVHRVVSAACASPVAFAQGASFLTVVPVRGAATVAVTSACAGDDQRVIEPGEAWTLTCVGASADLSGTAVQSDKPVVVLSGNVVTTVPAEGGGLSGDLVLDAPLPLDGLTAVTYLSPPLPRQAAHAGGGDIVRLVAGAAAVVRVRDDRGGDESRALAAGEVWDVDTAAAGADRTLLVESDGPLVAWHLPKSRAFRGTGDPAAVPLVPAERFTTADRFFVPDGYSEGAALVVVGDPGARVRLDGADLPALQGGPGGVLGWVRVELPPPPAGEGAVHALTGERPFGAWVLLQGGYKAAGFSAASTSPQAADPVVVLRGVRADDLAEAAVVEGTAWQDDAPGARVYYRVVSDAVRLDVARCGGATCLTWSR